MGKVEKILTYRLDSQGKKEFLVKFENKSYRKNQWVTDDWLSKGYMIKYSNFMRDYGNKPPPIEVVSPLTYSEIDKILSRRDINGTAELFIKWKGLSYEDCKLSCG